MGRSEFIVDGIGVKFLPDESKNKGVFYKSEYEYKFADIKVVGIKLFMPFDDEMYSWVFVDKYNNVYHIGPDDAMTEGDFVKILNKFNLKVSDFKDFPHDNYITGYSEILFPNKFKGNPLFRDRNLLEALTDFFRFFFRKESFVLNIPLIEEVKAHSLR